MRKIEIKDRIVNYSKLKDFGFVKERDYYLYKKLIMNDNFEIIIKIENQIIFSYVIDKEFEEEFTNVDVNTSGEFIGSIKNEYDNVINTFIEKCTEMNINYHDQVKEIIKYINNKYGDSIEYLWENSSSGIFRNKKNKKWYAAILDVKENRISGESEEIIYVIDLMYYKDKTQEIIDKKNIYPGYHMNKKSWITIKLDGTINNDFIFKYIDISYNLAINK